ncbi:MAG: polysaccharide biosynthesis/export family protein [Cyanobacteria bacterium J06621_3]
MNKQNCANLVWIACVGLAIQHTSANAQSAPALPVLPSEQPSVLPSARPSGQLPARPEALPVSARNNIPFKSGDLVRVTVVGFPDFSGEQPISQEGTIYLPMAGDVDIVGFSNAQAIRQIETSLLPFIRRPQVSLTLVRPSPLRISVTGAVLRPGPRSLELTEVGSNNAVKLSEVLVAAGGIAPTADLRNITIQRAIPTAADPSGYRGNSTIVVDFWDAIQLGDLSADPIIYDGDEIVIPTASINNVDQQMLLSSTVAPTQVVVSVAGEVRRPGQLEIAPTADVNAAIAAAGGLTPDASTDGISLFRVGSDGQLSREDFEFGEATTNIMNGDLVFVEKSRTSNVLDLLDVVSSPIRLILDAFF